MHFYNFLEGGKAIFDSKDFSKKKELIVDPFSEETH